jgi:hypothetical protein
MALPRQQIIECIKRRPRCAVYSPTRAERGNAISTENPSFDEGADGGCGCAICSALSAASPADFVSSPMANFMMAGAFQLPFRSAALSDRFARIGRPQGALDGF